MLKIVSFLIAISILFLPVTVFARPISGNNMKTTITSTGSGIVKVKPNGAKLYTEIKIINKSHKAAFHNLTRKANEITSHFDKSNKKVPKSNATFLIKTVQINIAPNLIYKNGNRIKDGYKATENLIIRIRGDKNTNNAILFLLQHKSVQIKSVIPTLPNLDKYKAKAVRLAYRHALLKAKAVLNLLKAKSFAIESIKIQSASPVMFPIRLKLSSAALPAAGYNEAKNQKVYFHGKDNVTATVFLKLRF